MQGCGYDAANRLQTLASPAGVFGYTYPSGASLISKITLPTGAYVTNTFDSLGRLTGTFLKDSAHAVLNSHAYVLNDLGQRLRQTRADGSYVEYGYDNIGQVISAVGREAGGGLRLHENLGFGYDLAGNLHYRTNNALVQTFGHNSLNELTSVSRAGTLTVGGAVSSPASSVSVNGLSATLYGDQTFARAGFALADGTNTFTAAGQESTGRTDSHTVAVRLPASAGYQYDGGGNLTSDGNLTFTYDWDGRLESYQVPYVWKVSFFYDGLGRLRFTREEVWDNTQGWVMRGEKRYLYDGYLVIQERDQDNVPVVTYTRGWDLSATCCDALGGIGGLLARTDHSALLAEAAEPHAYYHADGSGNVTMLVDSLDRPVAKYLYDPYGNLVGQSGPLAEANVYRFSSKAYDARSGLYNFGRRFYAPSLQRWLSRDPIGIEGGINLYAFVGNQPLYAVDPWGAAWFEISQEEWDALAAEVPDPWTGWVSPQGTKLGFCPAEKTAETYSLKNLRAEELGDDPTVNYYTTVAHNMVIVMKEGAKLTPINSFSEAVLGESVDGSKVGVIGRAAAIASAPIAWIRCGKKAVVGVGAAVAGADPARAAAKTGPKLLNQFNSAESLIQNAGNLTKLKGGVKMGTVTGDGEAIFKAISNGGQTLPSGYVKMADGTIIGKHIATSTGQFTIDINQTGQIFKIRVNP